jgi:hypothetical protein
LGAKTGLPRTSVAETSEISSTNKQRKFREAFPWSLVERTDTFSALWSAKLGMFHGQLCSRRAYSLLMCLGLKWLPGNLQEGPAPLVNQWLLGQDSRGMATRDRRGPHQQHAEKVPRGFRTDLGAISVGVADNLQHFWQVGVFAQNEPKRDPDVPQQRGVCRTGCGEAG